MVPDVEEEIVAAVRALSARYDYVFTTGGIGPTHDDITADKHGAGRSTPGHRLSPDGTWPRLAARYAASNYRVPSTKRVSAWRACPTAQA